jgi:hypothetical protein
MLIIDLLGSGSDLSYRSKSPLGHVISQVFDEVFTKVVKKTINLTNMPNR